MEKIIFFLCSGYEGKKIEKKERNIKRHTIAQPY